MKRCTKCLLSRSNDLYDVNSAVCTICHGGRKCVVCNRFQPITSQDKWPVICFDCKMAKLNKIDHSFGVYQTSLLDYAKSLGKIVVPHGTIGDFARKLDKKTLIVVYTKPMIVVQRSDAIEFFSGCLGAEFLGSLTEPYKVIREVKIGPLSAYVSYHKTWNQSLTLATNVIQARWKQENTPWDADQPYCTLDKVNGTIVWASRNAGLSTNKLIGIVDRKEVVAAVKKIMA